MSINNAITKIDHAIQTLGHSDPTGLKTARAISNATDELRCALNDLEGVRAALKAYESRM